MQRLPVAIVSLLLFCQNIASACECGPPAAACAYVNRAGVVFVGKVVFSNDDQSGTFVQQTLVRFEVEDSFKGLPSGTRDVWIDPGSFTSCYAEYHVGERWLIFAYNGFRMPADTAAVSVVPGQNVKPLPPGIDPNKPPTVYSAPECSGSRLITPETQASVDADFQYLRRFKAGIALPTVTGRVNPRDFDFPSDEGLASVRVTLSGNGLALSTLTDSNGRYSFDPVPVGKYSLGASLPSYLPTLRRQTVEVPASGCGYADFVMVGTGVIQGLLVDHAGRPLSNVEVDIVRVGIDGQPDNSKSGRTKSDRSGSYRFANLPHGTFQIGVNLLVAPDAKTPYKQTLWIHDGNPSIHLNPGQKKDLSPLRLPVPAKAHRIDVEVHWPDGRPGQGVTVWGEIGNEPGDYGETDAQGVTHLELLEGFTYNVEAKIWVGPKDNQEVARSGPTQWSAPSGPDRLTLVLTQRSKQYK
jgi:hypothetical protein